MKDTFLGIPCVNITRLQVYLDKTENSAAVEIVNVT